MTLHTPRCTVYQLTAAEFRQFIETPRRLWKSLGVLGEDAHEPWFRDIMRQALRTLEELGCEAWWLSNWPIVEISRKTVIGGITFKGPPDEQGEVEIGYGIADAYQDRGYMTECIHVVVQWALQQHGVTAVIAETAKDNPASEIVLRKNDFEHTRDTEEFRYWRKRRDVPVT